MQVAVTTPVLSHLSDSYSDSCASFDNIMHPKCGHLWSFREPLRRRLIYQSELFLTSFRLSANRCWRMVQTLQFITILVVSVAMALNLAHALELPGKLRLSKEYYLVTQQIYYPGFTYGGLAEPIGLVLLLVLLVTTPAGPKFWLTTAALMAFLLMHATYWLV